jgi:hypothetical protein
MKEVKIDRVGLRRPGIVECAVLFYICPTILYYTPKPNYDPKFTVAG